MAKEVTITTGTIYSVVAPGTKINGDIYSDADFRLDGSLVGDIVCEGKLIMGPNATIDGNITCNNSEISGIVNGNVISPVILSLKSTSRINGSIRTSTLMIEPGAVFNGACEMVQPAAAE